MSDPTPEQIERLPKWARHHLARMRQELDVAVAVLQRHLDEQTPSKIWSEEITTIDGSTEFLRRYLQAERIEIEHAGVHLDICLHQGERIDLAWRQRRMAGMGDLCFVPTGYQQARLTNMAYDENTYQRLVNGRKWAERKDERDLTGPV